MLKVDVELLNGLLRISTVCEAIGEGPIRDAIESGHYQRIFLELGSAPDRVKIFEMVHAIAEILKEKEIRLYDPIVVSVGLLPKDEQRELLDYFEGRSISATNHVFDSYLVHCWDYDPEQKSRAVM